MLNDSPKVPHLSIHHTQLLEGREKKSLLGKVHILYYIIMEGVVSMC